VIGYVISAIGLGGAAGLVWLLGPAAVLSFTRNILSGLGEWLSRRSLSELVCLSLVLFAALMFVLLKVEKRHSAKLQGQVVKIQFAYNKCVKDRTHDFQLYQDAQDIADRNNKAEVQRIERNSQRITDEAQSAYARDHAELIRLRREGNKGSAGSSSPSQDGSATQGADGTSGLSLSPEEVLRAQELELRLRNLQQWVNDQLKAQDQVKGVSGGLAREGL
jgi:hypothetical protein